MNNNIKAFENYGCDCNHCYDSKEILCPDCYNTGNNENCQVCQGSGYVECTHCKEVVEESNEKGK